MASVTQNYCLGTFMRSCTLTTWFLLGYFALLVNLGPSLHHAGIFGLHSHVSAESDSDRDGATTPCCCCQHHASSQDGPVDSSSSGFDVDNTCHDCALCEFFKHFNAFDHAFDFETAETRARIVSFANESLVDYDPFASSARGPPSV